jgi:Predicted unusual protein kinase
MNENNRLSGRLRRYGQVGGRAAGFGLRATGSLIRGRGLNNDELADQLVASLGELRGPLVKVAQILATIPDAVPARFQDAFAKLHAHAPSMGKRFVARRMKAELGEDWQSRFLRFSETSNLPPPLDRSMRHNLVWHQGGC